VRAGTLDDPLLIELSGLAASRLADDLLWGVNDSGNEPLLHAIAPSGEVLGRVRVEGATEVDWEDLASFVHDGKSYLLIADVGDNQAVRPLVALVLVEEPRFEASGALPAAVEPVWTRWFRYEDGPRDCEAVAVDVSAGRILLVSKRAVPPSLYELPLEFPQGDTVPVHTAKKTADLALPRPGVPKRTRPTPRGRYASQPTALDVDPGGRVAWLQTYTAGYEFHRAEGASWAETFAAEPRRVDVPRMRQIEAAAFGRSGRDVWISSERRPAPLFRLAPAAGTSATP
jgi:hypothetical protein